MVKTLRILCQNDVAREVGYTKKKINDLLRQDVIEGTPGVRFPLPLRPPPGAVPGVGRKEWSAADLQAWIERRRQK